MKILHLSDTHTRHRALGNLPEADVVVHSGDFCMVGGEKEAIDFLNWFCDLPYAHKIFICGNHDTCLFGSKISGLDDNTHYLCSSGITIECVKFYGVPMFIHDCTIGRQRYYAQIPRDTDVLITHQPPYGILDLDNGFNYGDEQLLFKVTEVQPLLHLFGHIHRQHGVVSELGIIFSNGAVICNDDSLPSPLNIFEL